MDFTSEQYEKARAKLRTSTVGRDAPVIVLGPLLQLLGTKTITAALCQYRDSRTNGQPVTTWRAAWLTDTHLLHVSATKNIGSWNSSDVNEDGPIPDELEAWSRPLSDVVAFEIADATVSRPADAKDFAWDFVYQVVFHDGHRLSLPLFGDYPNDAQERDTTAEFWASVRDAV